LSKRATARDVARFENSFAIKAQKHAVPKRKQLCEGFFAFLRKAPLDADFAAQKESATDESKACERFLASERKAPLGADFTVNAHTPPASSMQMPHKKKRENVSVSRAVLSFCLL